MSGDERKKQQRQDENEIGEDANNQEEAELIVPPDGGWGWVVVAASFLCTTMVDGIVNASGILKEPMQISLGESETTMAFVSSLLAGFYLIAGPFVSAMANRYGFRIVTMVGALLAAVCFSISYFATDVYYIFIIYSIIGGVGLSMIYIPAVVIVGFYFEKWRALATGISMCGSGVGTFVFAPLTQMFLDKFQWRGTMIAYGILIGLCAVFAIVFRPLKPVKVTVTSKDREECKDIEMVDKADMLAKGQQKSDSGIVYLPLEMQNKSTPHTWMGVAPNDSYPTAAEVFRKSHTNLDMRRSSATAAAIKSGNGHTKPANYIVVSVKEGDENGGHNGKNENTVPLLSEATKIILNDASGERRDTLTGRKDVHNRSRRSTLTGDSQISRPMYREDIFFGGSLHKIPQYQSRTSIGYHLSVTHLPTVTDVNEEANATCTICPEAVKRTLVTMLDFSLLKSPTFLLLAFSGFFSMLGFYAPFLYITQRDKSQGLDESYAVWLISVIGVANTFGRILCGVISSLKGANTLWINNIAITVGGIATMMSGISYSVGYQYTYCILFGLSIACFASLRSVIAVELMGLEKLTNAFGLLMMFQGLSAIIGAPIAGALKDLSGDFDLSFYAAGAFYTFSAFLCYPLNYVSQWEKRRALNQ